MKLKFSEKRIKKISDKYSYPKEVSLEHLSKIPKKELTKNELKIVCQWKSPRSANHVENNSDDYVREITRFALSTKIERARVEGLTLLDGVGWPTASAILHWFHKDQYPILDFRALWSVGTGMPKQYTFDFWWDYVLFCRKLAKRNKVNMRVLDRALWQYSYENQ